MSCRFLGLGPQSVLLSLIAYFHIIRGDFSHIDVITNFTKTLVNTQQAIVFSSNRDVLLLMTRRLLDWNQFVRPVAFNTNYTLSDELTRMNHARTSVIVDCTDNSSSWELLSDASKGRFINKTYQWLLLDSSNFGLEGILPPDMEYFGPNAQLTYVNGSDSHYSLWDVHSKGRHLGSPFELNLIAEGLANGLHVVKDIYDVQGIQYRAQFNGLTLRSGTVIDQDNITTNEQIVRILSRPTKDPGVAAFTKYYYQLLCILSERLNFTVNIRNARSWAGRLGQKRFRLGFLGMLVRNEIDVGASGAFNRINRFAELDTVHQSWKFETAFVYRFTPKLDVHSKSGNFLAPFNKRVWIFASGTMAVIISVWCIVGWIYDYCRLQYLKMLRSRSSSNGESSSSRSDGSNKNGNPTADDLQSDDTTLTDVSLQTIAAICQQGLDPLPKSVPSRTIVFVTFVFSLVMYNYYTSSVVGGLLSSSGEGPSTVEEITDSRLKLSFEDIAYYRIYFQDNKSPRVVHVLNRKVLPPRDPGDLPVYTHLEDAIPYIKNGSAAFHCELVDAYPEIAKKFDAGEICDLRVVSGFLSRGAINWNVHKNSQYTELFRSAMTRVREAGLVKRLLLERRPEKPRCQALYTVYPVGMSGVSSAFKLLIGGILISLLIFTLECYFKHYLENRKKLKKIITKKILNFKILNSK